MEQSPTVVLEYHKAESQGANAYWTGTVEGHEKKLVRVLASVAHPQLDRQSAAVIVLGEVFRSFAPMDLWGLAAACGTWPFVKNALGQFCRDLQPSDIICEDEQSRKLVWPVTDSLVGKTAVTALSAVAPPHTLGETGRQNIDVLINEDRLHIGHLLDVMNDEKDQSDRALRCAVGWALEYPAFYAGKKRGPLEYKRLWGES